MNPLDDTFPQARCTSSATSPWSRSHGSSISSGASPSIQSSTRGPSASSMPETSGDRRVAGTPPCSPETESRTGRTTPQRQRRRPGSTAQGSTSSRSTHTTTHRAFPLPSTTHPSLIDENSMYVFHHADSPIPFPRVAPPRCAVLRNSAGRSHVKNS